jgi:hypothetical protein
LRKEKKSRRKGKRERVKIREDKKKKDVEMRRESC